MIGAGKKSMTLNLDLDMLDAVEVAADKSHKSTTAWIREAISAKLADDGLAAEDDRLGMIAEAFDQCDDERKSWLSEAAKMARTYTVTSK